MNSLPPKAPIITVTKECTNMSDLSNASIRNFIFMQISFSLDMTRRDIHNTPHESRLPSNICQFPRSRTWILGPTNGNVGIPLNDEHPLETIQNFGKPHQRTPPHKKHSHQLDRYFLKTRNVLVPPNYL